MKHFAEVVNGRVMAVLSGGTVPDGWIEVPEALHVEAYFDGTQLQPCTPSPVAFDPATLTLSSIPVPADLSIAGAFIAEVDSATVELSFDEPGRRFVTLIPHDPSVATWTAVVESE